MNDTEVKQSLKTQTAKEFVATKVLGQLPVLFSGDHDMHDTWRSEFSQRIGVSPESIVIVGSAAIGCSLNPYKNYKLFDDQSDVDVAIISETHFLESWRYLRANNHQLNKQPPKIKQSWEEHKVKYIFWGTIATDRLLAVFPFAPAWNRAVAQMRKIDPSNGRDISLRLYADMDALRSYQCSTVRMLQKELR